jgi:hypothetical protein
MVGDALFEHRIDHQQLVSRLFDGFFDRAVLMQRLDKRLGGVCGG